LATADWSVKQAKILNAKPIGTIWKSLNNVPGWSDLGPDVGKLCAFQFADLRHSGELSLVVSYDNGGTTDCNMVDVLDKTPAGTKDYAFNDAGLFYFDSIEDINGDGHQELIVDKVFAAGSQTGPCTVTSPVIYAWNGNGYADVSKKYRKYYEELLSLPDSAASDVNLQDCEKASTAKIERFLGSREAGLSDAIKWAASDDPDTRLFGVAILRDIGTPRAIACLRKMSRDPHRKDTHFVKRPDVNPTIQGELLTPDYASPFSK
jgi:hypothetical protein